MHLLSVSSCRYGSSTYPGSHIDWADNDDSLPDLNEWGYTGDVAASVQPKELPNLDPIYF